jgi:DNA-directed RNA polymerase specialized sigma24 family protein
MQRKFRYDTVRECTLEPWEIERLSDHLQSQGFACCIGDLLYEGPDPVRLAQVKDVIESVVSGRKYEVLLLRSQGKTTAEIALLLSVSKSTVQAHYRRAVYQVRHALGFTTPQPA